MRVAITAASALVGDVFGVSALWRRVLKAESIAGETLPLLFSLLRPNCPPLINVG